MLVKTVKVAGATALQELDRYRTVCRASKLYPFLIRDDDDLRRFGATFWYFWWD